MGVDYDFFVYDSDEEGSSYDREIEDVMFCSIERRLRVLGK